VAIRAVIFDLDGTLYAMTPIFKPLLTLFSGPHFLWVPKYMKVRDQFRGKEMGSGQNLKSAICSLFEEKSSSRNGEEWIEKKFYPAFIKTLLFLRNRTEINTLLKELKSKNIKLAVLSDFGRVEERLNALKIDASLFDIIESTEDFGAFKPSPRPFLEICSKLDTKPSETLLVGDRTDTDEAGAKASGLNFFKVEGKSNKNWQNSMEELLKLF
jgi:HAD superfamily hydrolase (TIGR01549 family)